MNRIKIKIDTGFNPDRVKAAAITSLSKLSMAAGDVAYGKMKRLFDTGPMEDSVDWIPGWYPVSQNHMDWGPMEKAYEPRANSQD